MALKNCPACGADSIFVPLVPAVGYDGTLYGGRSEGFCNSPRCDQLLWYYPRSGRVTRRTVGITLKDYWLRRADISAFNLTRRRVGLSPVLERSIAVLSLPSVVGPDTKPFKIKYADLGLDEALTWYERVKYEIVSWYYWLLAAVKPSFKKDENDG